MPRNFTVQSPLPEAALPRHVAIVMDGNGRWAAARGLPRVLGHRAGAEAVRRIVEAARRAGIRTLTLFAFSGDNWGRPAAEVVTLMGLFDRYLATEAARCASSGIRLRVVGRRDRLPAGLEDAIAAAEASTASGQDMELRIAIDYSARDTVLAAAGSLAGGKPTRGEFAAALGRAMHGGEESPDVDLVIRTGGERRLSDFLLWECAYAELHFTDTAWPDMEARDLHAALAWFATRERRFGRTPVPVSAAAPAAAPSFVLGGAR